MVKLVTVPGFYYRLLWLLGAVGLFLLWDLRQPRGKRHRWGEYLYLLGAGVCGACFGIAVDTVTSTISPEYFIHGKGLGDGPGFFFRVLELGAQAVFGAAILGAGILLLANPEPGQLRRLIALSPFPFLAAASGALALGTLQFVFKWIDLPGETLAIGASRAHRYATVWLSHVGLYAGGALGVLGTALFLRRSGKIRG